MLHKANEHDLVRCSPHIIRAILCLKSILVQSMNVIKWIEEVHKHSGDGYPKCSEVYEAS